MLNGMQVITSIPTSILPKCVRAGTVTQEQLEIIDRGDSSTKQFAEELNEDMGQILWVRGLTRLQNQVWS
jgi:Plasma membrane calcium transporter ATPase C terminal